MVRSIAIGNCSAYIDNNFDGILNEENIELLRKVKNISIRKGYNNSLDFLESYDNIKYMICFDYRLPINKYPISLTKLELLGKFNQPVNNLPTTLKELKLGDFFNQPLDNLPNIESLFVGDFFNCSLDYLPDSLKKLSLGNRFNQKIDNLPSKLEKIVIGREFFNGYFNKSIDNLPNSIEHIEILCLYKKEIKKLPINLHYIKFGHFYSKKIPSTKAIIENGPTYTDNDSNSDSE